MARNALKWIIVALVIASLLVGATVVLTRLQTQQATTPVQVPVESIALPLDQNGIGTQYLSSAILSVKLSPYPPRANTPSSLTLIALDPRTQAVKEITPTLSVADLSLVEGNDYAMKRTVSGAYEASGNFFAQAGKWRVRIRIDLGEREPYSIPMVVEAR